MYKITVKQYGNAVTYIDDANVDPKEALQAAKSRALDIFNVRDGDAKPTVSVSEIIEKN